MSADVSHEQLNALVDGELDRFDEAAILDAALGDAQLQQGIGELRNAKDLVRHAYGGVAPVAAGRLHHPRDRSRRLLAAASVLIVAGGATGWWAHAWQQQVQDADISRLAQRARAVAQIASPERVVLHVSSSAPERLAGMLDDAEDMLRAARATGKDVAIEVVANGGGLDILRADGPAQATGRLVSLHAEFPNLTLVACAQTIERLREKGVSVRLLPQATVAASALDEIVKRMHEGWTYVRT